MEPKNGTCTGEASLRGELLPIDQRGNWLEAGGFCRIGLSLARQELAHLPVPDTLQSEASEEPLRTKNKPDPSVELERDKLERTFLEQIRAVGLPEPAREYRFHDTRKWRFDFAWPALFIAVEIEGGTWSGKSRHTTGAGYHGDLNKYNAAHAAGWTVYRFDSKHVSSGDAARAIEQLLADECV